ncbi:hypothetical protein D068_cds11150 [Bacillus atrophaeus UCMB-5137]|nr:hypothetical protein D068_cds11150 [Bacillus atrophaeus UCMB-5137]
MEKGKFLISFGEFRISFAQLKTESLFLSREAEGLARRSFSNRCNDCIRSHDQGAKSSKLEQLGR